MDNFIDNSMAMVAFRLENFFAANTIDMEEKILAVKDQLQVLHNLVEPAKPGEKSYKDLVDKLTLHFCQPLSEMIQIVHANEEPWRNYCDILGRIMVAGRFL